MVTKAIYARIPVKLHDHLGQQKEMHESMSSTIERLLKRGIENVSSETELNTAHEELTQLKDKVLALEKERAELHGSKESLKGQLQACKAQESIALAAQSHVEALQSEVKGQNTQMEQLRFYLSTHVATCNKCHNKLTLYDIGQARCQYCGNWGPTWLPKYTPPPTSWDIVKNGAAVVGSVTVIAALLNALNSNRE